MRAVPFELPVKASEAATLAGVLLDQVEGRALTDDLRNRLASRLAGLPPFSFTVFPASLQKDPIHPSVYYIAVGPAAGPDQTILLRIARASSPSSGLFPYSLLIGRMRTESGSEIVINAVSFASTDLENIQMFVDRVDRSLAPRPQRTLAAIEVTDGCLDAFQAFHSILKSRNVSVASIYARDSSTALWPAILSGWRHGYTAATAVQPGEVIDTGFSKYRVDASAELASIEKVYDAIQIAKGGPRARFDFEVSLADAPALTTPSELVTCLDYLKTRSKPAQFIAPNLELRSGGLSPHLDELAEIARSYNATLSIHATGDEPPEIVERIGKATRARVNYKIPGNLEASGIVRLAEQLNL